MTSIVMSRKMTKYGYSFKVKITLGFLKLLPYTFIRLTRNAEVKYTDVFGGYPQWGEITFTHLCFTKK